MAGVLRMRGLWVALALLWVGCAQPAAATPERVRLTVFAASSLTDVLEDLARSYEAAHPQVQVALSFAGSQILQLQVEQGAPADVFLSANARHVADLEAAGLLVDRQLVARNRLALIVPSDNPADVRSLATLGRAERLVLGSQEAPVGRYSRALIARAAGLYGPSFARKVLAGLASEESNVRLVRAKVALGEADAAIVYRSDVPGVAGIAEIALPDPLNPTVDVLGGVRRASPQADEARRWLAHLASPAGRAAFAARGFVGVP